MSLADVRVYATAVILFLAMVLSAVVGVRQRLGCLLLAMLSVVWLFVDRLWEGPVIIAVTSHNGLVTSDLVGIAGLVVAAWLFYRPFR